MVSCQDTALVANLTGDLVFSGSDLARDEMVAGSLGSIND